ncbi:hypothetical protein PVK06_045971 [Gossypium arboreum]|uniref:Uncharacterized protein n=1 Tax=Gossypium arboreum TaxID=29729 RepID=A0ABR0MVI3_GOSAR|nr:hypothetical protein PVK06_045971 [Gossypium arboreum]
MVQGLTVSNDSHCFKSDTYGESPPLISRLSDDDMLTVAYTSNAQHHVLRFVLMACKVGNRSGSKVGSQFLSSIRDLDYGSNM